ncbi:MAG: trigger factor [Nitrospiraceae bacterium]|nr:MAG: trigger factor [Nitrospiraceae bacterium]
METTVEDISTTKKRLKIEIPSAVIREEYNSSLNNVKMKAKIPGFRPGKIPNNLIEKKFGDNIRADIIDRLVPQYYSKALKDADLVPVTMPTLEDTLEIKKDQPLSFSLTVEVRPKISDLTYTELKVEEIPVQVDDHEVDETLKRLRDDRAVVSVVDRPVQEDDLIIIDYTKLDPAENKELSSGTDQLMNLGNNLVPKGILDELIGKQKGDVIEINIPAFDASGQTGELIQEEDKGNRIRITIKEIKEKILPEIDDDFAKELGQDTLISLKEKIREGILNAKNANAAKQQKSKLLATIVDSHDFDIPESLLEKELQTLMINEKASIEQAKGAFENKDEDVSSKEASDTELMEKLKPTAVQNVKSMILLDMIAEKEHVSVSEEELKSRILLLAQQFQSTPETIINLFVTKDGSLDNLKNNIKDEKVLDLLLSKAETIKGE